MISLKTQPRVKHVKKTQHKMVSTVALLPSVFLVPVSFLLLFSSASIPPPVADSDSLMFVLIGAKELSSAHSCTLLLGG